MFAPARRKTDPKPAWARNLVWLAPLALTALVGCATRNDLYVLLPGKDGKTGALIVNSEGKKQTLDTPYAAARVKNVGSVDSVKSSADEVKQDFSPALEAQPKRPVSFFLYFLSDTDEFAGSSQYNDALSRRRAERCRDELFKLGIPKVRISVAGRGWREPEVPTAQDVPEPRNRRVEISVR